MRNCQREEWQMMNNIYKEGLVVGIIVLLVFISLMPLVGSEFI